MSDKWFPRTIKPLTSKPYSFSRGKNLTSTEVGGMPRIALDRTIEEVYFKLNFLVSDTSMMILLNFYDVAINHGEYSFKMNLDGGMGIEEHQCKIVPRTFNAPRPAFDKWAISFDVVAESTSSQLQTDDSIYVLGDVYGDQLPLILAALQNVVESFPND